MDDFRHPKCYAAELGGCSPKISKEHFISLGVLKHLNDSPMFRVGGFPNEKMNRAGTVSPETLRANILCGRHNSELSSLDKTILEMFRWFDDAATHADHGPLGMTKTTINGQMVERWMLKALLGVIASGNAIGPNKKPITKLKPPLGWLRVLYGIEPMPNKWGLYLLNIVGELTMQAREIRFAVITDLTVIKGAMCHIHGFRFLLAMETPEDPLQGTLLENSVHHPGHITLVHENRTRAAQLYFEWSDSSVHVGPEVTFKPHFRPMGADNS